MMVLIILRTLCISKNLGFCLSEILTVHRGLARFIWGHVVQQKLNQHKEEHATHKIRTQKKRLLPSGGQPIQFYTNPEQYNGMDCLIAIPPEDIQLLVSEFIPDNLFYFCSEPLHNLATQALSQLGDPQLTVQTAWAIFSQLLPIVKATGIVEGRLSFTPF